MIELREQQAGAGAAAVAELRGLSRRFGSTAALDGVDLALPAGSIIGLIGRNGSGKTTLLRVLAGLLLPDAGTCRVLGVPSERLDEPQLRQLGYVPQEGRLLAWMSVRQHLDYVAAFHPHWDEARERRLVDALELDLRARVGTLSPGNAQKLAITLAVCHHPSLLLLDEPVSALDPLARETLLAELLALLNEDGLTIVISSHVLRDVERVVDRIVCLERGRVVQDAALDDLKERYAEWRVVSRSGRLPARFAEPFVLTHSGNSHLAQLCVLDAADSRAAFEARHEAEVNAAPLNLERMFPLWAGRAVRS